MSNFHLALPFTDEHYIVIEITHFSTNRLKAKPVTSNASGNYLDLKQVFAVSWVIIIHSFAMEENKIQRLAKIRAQRPSDRRPWDQVFLNRHERRSKTTKGRNADYYPRRPSYSKFKVKGKSNLRMRIRREMLAVRRRAVHAMRLIPPALVDPIVIAIE